MMCDKCKSDKADAIPRLFPTATLERSGFVRQKENHKGEMVDVSFDPTLCTACCAEMPGRAWMRECAS